MNIIYPKSGSRCAAQVLLYKRSDSVPILATWCIKRICSDVIWLHFEVFCAIQV